VTLASIADLNGPPEVVAARIEQAKELSAMYDDFILLDKEEGHYRAPGIHASELYPCLRKPVYCLTDVPKNANVSKFWKQRFKVGSAIHSMVQADFHRMAKRSKKGDAMRVAQDLADKMDCFLEFEDEVKVSPQHQALAAHYQLYSSADGVFTFRQKSDGVVVLRVGLEIKTESPGEYEKLTEPKPGHVIQAHIYMACLDLPLMWFFYMNKGNQNNTDSKSPYLITWKPDVWLKLEDRLKTVLDFAARGELPEKTETIMCEFCPWSYTCQPKAMMRGFSNKPNRRETVRKSGA